MIVKDYGEVNEFFRMAYRESDRSRCKVHAEGVVIISRWNECIGNGYRRVLVNEACRSGCAQIHGNKKLCMKIHSIEMAISIAHARGNAKKLPGSTLYCVKREILKKNPADHYPKEQISLIHSIPFSCCVDQVVLNKINVALWSHDNRCVVFTPKELSRLMGCGKTNERHELAALVYGM